MSSHITYVMARRSVMYAKGATISKKFLQDTKKSIVDWVNSLIRTQMIKTKLTTKGKNYSNSGVVRLFIEIAPQIPMKKFIFKHSCLVPAARLPFSRRPTLNTWTEIEYNECNGAMIIRMLMLTMYVSWPVKRSAGPGAWVDSWRIDQYNLIMHQGLGWKVVWIQHGSPGRSVGFAQPFDWAIWES